MFSNLYELLHDEQISITFYLVLLHLKTISIAVLKLNIYVLTLEWYSQVQILF